MKMILKETINGKTVITTEGKKIFRKPKIQQFEAQEEYPTGYWKWLELPNRTIVYDRLSFQLNEWNKL